MKKALTKKTELHHYKNGVRIKGAKKNMSGNYGELWGDCSGLSGNLDDCEITEEERSAGINIEDLVI